MSEAQKIQSGLDGSTGFAARKKANPKMTRDIPLAGVEPAKIAASGGQ